MRKPKSQEKPVVHQWKKIDRSKSRPVYQQIQDLVLDRIHDGTWKPGELIESAPKLARKLGISYATVCRAIDVLVARGILTTRSGAGTYVSQTALQRRVLWINGLNLNRGDISPYFLHNFDAGMSIFRQHNIEVDSIWVGLGEDPLSHSNLAQGEVLNRYSGVVLHACHEKHPVRAVLSRYGIESLDLFHGIPNSSGLQVQRICSGVLREWQSLLGPSVLIIRENLPFENLQDTQRLIIPGLDGVAANEQWGYRATWLRLEQGNPPAAWLVMDDIVARGVTRAILAHRNKENSQGRPWPKVVVSSSEKTVLWHGFPVDYILVNGQLVIESVILPFVDKLLGRKPRKPVHQQVARYVPWDDPTIAHLKMQQDT